MALLHAAFDANDAVVTLDRDGRIVHATDEYCAAVGHAGEDLRGHRWCDVARIDSNAPLPCRVHSASETDRLRQALEANRWNESKTARWLGISRTTLWRRMRKHGLSK